MTTAIDPHRRDIEALCRQFAVRRLELFGSAAGVSFDATRSDVDFGSGEQADLFNRYFGLKQALEQTLGRDVDHRDGGRLGEPALHRFGQPHAAAGVCTNAQRSGLRMFATRRPTSPRSLRASRCTRTAPIVWCDRRVERNF